MDTKFYRSLLNHLRRRGPIPRTWRGVELPVFPTKKAAKEWCRERIEYTSPSTLALLACPRKWYYVKVLNLVPQEPPRLTYGKIFHRWLADYYEGKEVEGDDLFKAYVRHDPFRDWEILGVEIELGAGRVDMIARSPAGQTWVIDHKTGARFPQNIKLNAQFALYLHWARRAGYEAVGVKVNFIRQVQPHPPKELKNGKLSMDTRQILVRHLCPDGEEWDWVLDKEREYFRVESVFFSDEDIQAVLQDMRVAQKAFRFYEKMGVPPRVLSRHCATCMYRGLCEDFSEQSVELWRMMFQEPWEEEGEEVL